MRSSLEAVMAQGRAAGVTQRALRAIGEDLRTLVLEPDGAQLISFATCSYLGLERDPRAIQGAKDALDRHGVVFSASRCFATSPLYGEVDALLAQIFGRPTVLAGSTTLAHGAALPILLEPDDVVFFDQQVHHSVQTALSALGPRGPQRLVLPHNDLDALETGLRGALERGARRVWYCADGVYSMFGDRLPLAGLVDLMRRHEALHAYLDDAHGMSWCGARGAGSLLDAPLPRERTVLATSLSKGFGAGGGVIAVPDQRTKERIENLGPSLMFSIQVPPPVLGAIAANARIHLSDELPQLQRRVAENVRLMNELLSGDPALAGLRPLQEPQETPIGYLIIGEPPDTLAVTQGLIRRGFLVNPVSYPAVPRGMGGVRFTITRAHTADDLRALVAAISAEARARGATRKLRAA